MVIMVRGPVWWYPMQKMYDDSNCPTNEELRIMKSRIINGVR